MQKQNTNHWQRLGLNPTKLVREEFAAEGKKIAVMQEYLWLNEEGRPLIIMAIDGGREWHFRLLTKEELKQYNDSGKRSRSNRAS